MSARLFKSLLLLTSALGATALVASGSGAVPPSRSVSELLDPGAIAAGVCGMGGERATAFKPLQLALATPAEAIAESDQAPPLWEGLGELIAPITTHSEMAQRPAGPGRGPSGGRRARAPGRDRLRGRPAASAGDVLVEPRAAELPDHDR